MERWVEGGSSAAGGAATAASAAAATAAGGDRMRLLLSNCLALELSRPKLAADDGSAPSDLWMYDAGYLLFQSFVASNAKCWWVEGLAAATADLRFAGFVAPGVLLLKGSDRALQTVRNAYAKNVLKPPPAYFISGLGEVEEWWSRTSPRGHFTPLPEALCHVIMDLTEQGEAATQESVRGRLASQFPGMAAPAAAALYDALAQLQRDGRAYRTARGYFVATPERRRAAANAARADAAGAADRPRGPRLLTDREALLSLYGEMHTERDGDVTHQCVQTNLADVICGGNPNDKILYGRPAKRRSSSCSPRSLDRRHSLRTLGGLLASKRSLHRCSSTRSLSRASKSSFKIYSDSGSSTDYPASTDSSPKKASLLSRLFRRSRSKTDARDSDRSNLDSCHNGELKTFSAQFPPSEWFNQRAIHLHCVATQTQTHIFQGAVDRSRVSSASPSPSPSCSSLAERSAAAAAATAIAAAGRAPAAAASRPRHRRHLSSDDAAPPAPLSAAGSLTRSYNKGMKNGSIKRIDYPSSYSGPSSLESKRSFPSSGHSSLESQDYTDSTLKRSSADLKRAQSLVKVYSLQSSPKSPHRLKSKPPPGTTATDHPSKAHQKCNGNGAKQTPSNRGSAPSDVRAAEETDGSPSRRSVAMNSSNSNGSITLKVTTNTSVQNGGGTNTKVYLQNSNAPMKSIITFENDNDKSNSNNVYIINGERSSAQARRNAIETSFEKTLPVNNGRPDDKSLKNNENSLKINKNEANLNNNRKMGLQMGNGLIFKNQLKTDNVDRAMASPTKSFENISFENLKYYEKNSPKSHKNSCSDVINADSCKKASDNSESRKDKAASEKSDKSAGSEPSLAKLGEKRLSLREGRGDEPALHPAFPSLSDLSCNFTSLAAQKILKGVSLNSVDTLAELNLADKQNNRDFANDLGIA